MLILLKVGHPIHVVQCDKPTLEEVMHVQQQYIDELMRYVTMPSSLHLIAVAGRSLTPFSGASCRIWHTYKDEFAKTRTRELNIIE